ncbi:MAG: AMP-binding protein, partial [Candidatus Binatia bacterium]
PRGVLGGHRSLSHFLPWQAATFGLGAADRFSMLSGLAHDPLQRDIFTPLWLGATLCIPDPEIFGTPRLAQWMAEEQMTFAHLTPALAELLTESAASDCRLPSLRYAFFVGDKLTRRDVARLRRLAPGVTCVSSYGTTETQRAVGYYIVPEEAEARENECKPVYPLGHGMKDVQLLVLTPGQRRAGVGELGEIYMRSPHLALGYLDEELTRERFLTNPFTGMPGDRLYKTGDLGRYLPDGNVEFAGRADRQVKIRGFRVEPAEIEAALTQHPSLREAVVVAREDTRAERSVTENPKPDKRLVAYLIARAEQKPSTGELRRFLKSTLPDYMVPSAFVFLDALPLTPNGKLDHSSLPLPDQRDREEHGRSAASHTPMEKLIADIWAEVLQVERIGIHENFFDLGGHSLLVTRVLSRVRETCQVELPLRALFEDPTVAGLAAKITHARTQEAAPEDTANVLAELESLSDEQVQLLLAQESTKAV